MNSIAEGVEEIINFEVARNQNSFMEDYSGLRRQGIYVDDDNNPAPDNTPQTNNTTTTTETALNCTGAEGIVCPRLTRNLPDTSACFKNYSNKDVKA